MIGTLLDGRYEIRSLLGAGAMGSVYDAVHTGTSRRVAIKVINSGDLTRDEKLVGRFQREAKAAGAIDTQHITQVLDTGRDRESGLPFMVMEFLSGEDLQHLLRRLGPIAPDLALRLAAQACIGLQKAHEAQVVHRDIKPANLFLAQRDAGELIVKLLDFGIAKVKMDHANETESAGLTKTGSMLGSPLYMSPEQARGSKSIDHRADIWSLGIVLYQALTGRTPFQHIEALGELIICICHEQVPPVQGFAPWVPPEVARVVHTALARDPAARYPTAQAMLDAIRPLLPYGWAVTADMLAPMSAEAKAYVAPRASMPPPGADGAAARTSMASVRPPPPLDPNATGGAMVQSQITPRRSTSMASIVVAVGVLGAAVGVGAWYTMGQRAALEQAQAAQTLPAPAREAAPAPAPVPATAAPALEPASRRVKLVIMPPDAVVELDGAKVPVEEGLVEITGAPGSVHKVRLSKGALELADEVIITEEGATPPKLELKKTAAPSARPSVTPSASPVAPATAQPVAPGIVDSFE